MSQALAVLVAALAGACLMNPVDSRAAGCVVTETSGPLTLNDPGGTSSFPDARMVTLENPRIVVRVSPDAGGNVIVGYVDKSRTNGPFHRQDESFEAVGQWKRSPATTCHIDARGPDRAAVTLIGTGTLIPYPVAGQPHPVPTELTLTRTVSIDADSTAVHVAERIANTGTGTVWALRCMVHALYSYKVLPGATVYAYLPTPDGIRLFDHEAIVKQNHVATLATEGHRYRRWSRPGDALVKARYPASGWLAMESDSGSSYLFYDPAQFDFVSLWSGTHPAEWLVLEPHTKAVDLTPGQRVDFMYALACDGRDVPFREPTLVSDPPQVPGAATAGDTLTLGLRVTTVRTQPEPVQAMFRLYDHVGATVLTQTLRGTAQPFLYTDVAGTCTVPAGLKPGDYRWQMADAGGGSVTGRLEVVSAAEAAKRKTLECASKGPAMAAAVFPPSAWTNGTGMTFVRIPAGSFLMGSGPDDPQSQPDEQPQHRVRITHAFLMAKKEVTNGQFRKFRSDHHNHPDRFHVLLTMENDGDDQPAATTHNTLEAEAFCEWLNAHDPQKPAGWAYRLPTEAEWEYAARGPRSLRYPWGDVWDSRRCEFGDQRLAADNRPAPVAGSPVPVIALRPVTAGSPAGDSPFGVSGMAGGMWEWCQDVYDPEFYRHSPVDDPVGAIVVRESENLHGEASEKNKHVLRGGSWGSLPITCRTAFRYAPCSTHNPTIGIRVVLAERE